MQQLFSLAIKGAIIAQLVLVSACMFAPGMDMERGFWRLHGPETVKAPGQQAGGGIENYLEVVEITQGVVARLKAQELAPSIPDGLLAYSNANPSEYRIGVNDVLSIIVWGQPELIATGGAGSNPLTERQVRDDGTIFFPYAGAVPAAGKTRDEVRQYLTKALDNYFKNPQVDVAVEQYNSQKVALTGEFNTPVTIPITGVPLTLAEAVALAKGSTELADITDMRITRDGISYSLNYHHLAKSGEVNKVILLSGDSVHMPINQSNKVYVVGEVGTPASVSLMTGSVTLTDALGAARGVSQVFSSGKELYVLRGALSESSVVYQLDSTSATAYLLASQFDLKAQDVVFVGPAELTKWNRVVSSLFPFANLIRAVDDVARD